MNKIKRPKKTQLFASDILQHKRRAAILQHDSTKTENMKYETCRLWKQITVQRKFCSLSHNTVEIIFYFPVRTKSLVIGFCGVCIFPNKSTHVYGPSRDLILSLTCVIPVAIWPPAIKLMPMPNVFICWPVYGVLPQGFSNGFSFPSTWRHGRLKSIFYVPRSNHFRLVKIHISNLYVVN